MNLHFNIVPSAAGLIALSYSAAWPARYRPSLLPFLSATDQ